MNSKQVNSKNGAVAGTAEAPPKKTADEKPASPSTPKKPEAAANPAAPKASKTPAKKPRRTKADLTLGELAAKYLAHMEREGKSSGTIRSYESELAVATAQLGADTKVASLTPGKVQEYFDSDIVTKTRTGVLKAKPTVDKTRRVIRLALVWAEEAKLIKQAPIPESN